MVATAKARPRACRRPPRPPATTKTPPRTPRRYVGYERDGGGTGAGVEVAMELCDGGCVETLLAVYGPFPWNIVARHRARVPLRRPLNNDDGINDNNNTMMMIAWAPSRGFSRRNIIIIVIIVIIVIVI